MKIMSTQNTKVWFITGSSTGFGRTLAETVLKNGDRIIATARKPEQLQDLIEKGFSSKERLCLCFIHLVGVRLSMVGTSFTNMAQI